MVAVYILFYFFVVFRPLLVLRNKVVKMRSCFPLRNQLKAYLLTGYRFVNCFIVSSPILNSNNYVVLLLRFGLHHHKYFLFFYRIFNTFFSSAKVNKESETTYTLIVLSSFNPPNPNRINHFLHLESAYNPLWCATIQHKRILFRTFVWNSLDAKVAPRAGSSERRRIIGTTVPAMHFNSRLPSGERLVRLRRRQTV